jgi:hypothetical protein
VYFMDVIKSAFEPFLDGEKKPLNVSEAYHLWYYLVGVEQSKRSAEVGINQTTDDELRNVLKDLINNVHNPIIEELTELLKKEGVPLPDSTPEKLTSGDFKEIPFGARLTDQEIANSVNWNELVGIQIAVRGMTESVRADIGATFAKYQIMKLTWSLTMKQLISKRGWLIAPPPFKS